MNLTSSIIPMTLILMCKISSWMWKQCVEEVNIFIIIGCKNFRPIVVVYGTCYMCVFILSLLKETVLFINNYQKTCFIVKL